VPIHGVSDQVHDSRQGAKRASGRSAREFEKTLRDRFVIIAIYRPATVIIAIPQFHLVITANRIGDNTFGSRLPCEDLNELFAPLRGAVTVIMRGFDHKGHEFSRRIRRRGLRGNALTPCCHH
jgi:hypothetical protein